MEDTNINLIKESNVHTFRRVWCTQCGTSSGMSGESVRWFKVNGCQVCDHCRRLNGWPTWYYRER